jgi:hypothetical protein
MRQATSPRKSRNRPRPDRAEGHGNDRTNLRHVLTGLPCITTGVHKPHVVRRTQRAAGRPGTAAAVRAARLRLLGRHGDATSLHSPDQHTTVRTSRFLEYGKPPPYAESTGSGTALVLRDGKGLDHALVPAERERRHHLHHRVRADDLRARTGLGGARVPVTLAGSVTRTDRTGLVHSGTLTCSDRPSALARPGRMAEPGTRNI